MQGLMGSVPLVIILAVGVCAPLAGWLAMQRARNPILWFVYGALTGPVAPLLLVAAPLGRCPSCDAPVRGWSGSCTRCGAPLGGILNGRPSASLVLAEPHLAVPGDIADPTATAAGATRSGRAAREAAAASASAAAATAGANRASRQPAAPNASRASRASAPAATYAPSTVAAATAAAGSGPAGAASAGEVLSTAVYLSGNAGLEIGACYAIARVEDRIRVFGPVDTGQLTVRHERPIDEGEVVAIDDRIILTLRSGRSSTSMIMRWVGGMQPTGLETALAPGAREGQSTEGLWR